MKIPIQLFVVRGTVYPFDIAFSIGQSDKTLAKFLSKYDDGNGLIEIKSPTMYLVGSEESYNRAIQSEIERLKTKP